MITGERPSSTTIVRTASLIVAAIILNIVGGYVFSDLIPLPLYLDSIGTILTGALLGPLAGAAVGATSNILWGILLNNSEAIPYSITAAFIGWAAGVAALRGAFDSPWRVVMAGLLTGIGAALISAPITAYLFGGVTGSGTDFLIAHWEATGANVLQAATLQGFISDPLDKAISFLIAWGIWKFLSSYFHPLSKRGGRPFDELFGYSAAVISSLLALLISFIFLPAFGRGVFSVFYLAVLISAWRGGWGPALLTIAIGAIANIALLISPYHYLGITPEDWLRVAFFTLFSLAIAYISNKREQATQALRQSLTAEREIRARVRAITDNVNEALMLVSPDQRLLDVNKQFEEMFGVPRDRVLQQKIADVRTMFDQLFADSDALFELVVESSADTEQDYQEIVIQSWPQARELSLYATPVRDEHGFLGRLFVFRDVTHEREVDRMKTEFVSLVSHELRTPLTSIKGFTEMVLDGDAGEINEEVEEFLGIVYANAERLVALVNDLLDISRIESGRIHLKRETVDLRQVVHTVTMTMQHLIDAKHQTLTVNLDERAALVQGDRDKIVQVLTNYVSNAYKYTPDEGEFRIDIERQGEFAHVAVTDNGYGISPKDQEQLFTRFYRVDNSLTSAIGGTGLGLSIVKAIVELQGGEVGVQSVEGEGSTFSFTVPLADTAPLVEAVPLADAVTAEAETVEESPPQPAAIIADHVAEQTEGQHILVVEDDLDVCQLIAHRLEKSGYQVRTAHSAEEALAALQEETPDLITLDVNLPGMNGYELAHRLRDNQATRNLPILIISVYDDEGRGLRFGAHSLSKPIDHEALLSTVAEMLVEHAARSVLIIEDDADVRQLLENALGNEGFDAESVVDGESGLSRAREMHPGLILLDMHLPGMDGFGVMRALKEDAQTMDIPVIAMTGHPDMKGLAGDHEVRARMLALGASDFIAKPFDMDALVEEIRIFINTPEV